MPFAMVTGLRLYYELHGDSGEPLVFVHGFTGDSADWRFQVGHAPQRERSDEYNHALREFLEGRYD